MPTSEAWAEEAREPELLVTVAEVRSWIAARRLEGRAVHLVPTMGALHLGHEALIGAAVADGGAVVVSIFVNPLQFGPSEDYARYPRNLAADREVAGRCAAAAIFAPSLEEMYPRGDAGSQGHATYIEVEGPLTEVMCARSRPGHFRGVATVVAKLLNIVEPDRVYFGEKDAQQLAVVRRFVADLDFRCEVRSVPTVRESDGLALSSRNAYLSAEERAVAPLLYRALVAGRDAAVAGQYSGKAIVGAAAAVLRGEERIRLEYLDLRDAATFNAVEEASPGQRLILALAAHLGSTRLIDNVQFTML